MRSQEEETRNALNIDRNVPSTSTGTTTRSGVGLGVGSQGATPVMPYVTLSDWLDNFFTRLQSTPLDGAHIPKLLTETQQMQKMLQSSSTSSSSDSGGKGSADAALIKSEGDKQSLVSEATLPSVSQPPPEATSTPKSSLKEHSGSLTSATKKPSLVSPLASVEVKESDEDKEMETGGDSVALQILKATAPFVRNSSTKEDDDKVESNDTPMVELNVDESDTPKSKRLRLTSPLLTSTTNKTTTSGQSQPFKTLDLNSTESSEEVPQDEGQGSAGDEQKEKERDGVIEVDVGAQILNALVTSWPAIVATVLGFYPPHVTSSVTKTNCGSGFLNQGEFQRCNLSQESNHSVSNETKSKSTDKLEFCSVHSLDSFTTNLILNCEEPTIDTLVGTIVDKMNAAVCNSVDKDSDVELSLLLDDVDFTKPAEEVCTLNDHNVALLVGQRFLNSVVRLQGLEHSRVKNAFVEMQQMRQSTTGRYLYTVHVYPCNLIS